MLSCFAFRRRTALRSLPASTPVRSTALQASRSFPKRVSTVLASGALLLAAMTPSMAHAEGTIRISEQFGVVYLLLNVARDQHLIEKAGLREGQKIDVSWVQLSGGAAINDALLSGSVDIASAGVGPLLTIWDRTHGRQNVKGVASLGSFPYYLISNNPQIKTIADFSAKDRIAVPAVGVSVQSRILQFAAAQQWGDAAYQKLDPITVALPHPDATAAIISSGTELDAHFGNPPFSEQELAANPKAHIVLDSYKVLGGQSSATVLYATQKYRDENPKTYHAFVEALSEAAEFIKQHPEQAADTYIRVNHSKIDRTLLINILKNPQVDVTVVPQNTYSLAAFMARTGAIRNKPASWQDYFFNDPALGKGG